MAKPSLSLNVVEQAIEGWDVDIDENFTDISTLFDNPLPIAEYDNATSLPTASSYDRCIAVKEEASSDWYLELSDGSSWEIIPKQAAAESDSTAANLADLVSDFNSLLAKLRATKVIAT